MTRLLALLKVLGLAVLILVGSLLGIGLYELRHVPAHIDGVLTRAEGVERKVYASAQNLDTATKAWSGAAETQAASVNALVQDARGTLAQTRTAIAGISTRAEAATDAVAGTANAATGAINQAHVDLATANESLAALQPLLQASTETVRHADATIGQVSPELNRMMVQSADTAEHVSGISGSVDKMSAHLEHDFDTPKPWWKKALPVLTDSAKLAECFTRGNCF